ncbi:VIT1/CCC1 transporter family protein [Aquimonas voraii]|uniref:Predicted Fe2+/Mn2+ transporter, VIT1/CCC1 family n=1 Tax=Aquimonas voraii TaxID=265719 RepID=A0A1G6XDW7_9GAMM|nr:VIT1/CCC1 transporter family protein [Aquimonas voraii]SDD75436.1 Predicted Fe2+/Mn2+ transporter, VIT1/CCC1 family [Aquimonas voraii]
MRRWHVERHGVQRGGWLRAAVLGANDGLISTASLVLGVVAAGGETSAVLVAGTAGLVAGALSMAAGEYISVSTQADIEGADLARERRELAETPEAELEELVALQQARGLPPALAREVAIALTAHDALGAHARDELGITEQQRARPVQAALASAAAFATGAGLPLLLVLLAAPAAMAMWVLVGSLVLLGALGALAAWAGGAPVLRGAARVLFWGGLAMACTWAAGALFGAVG